MMTDNVAVLAGFTEEWTADNEAHVLYLMVKPGTDFDSAFKAWDTDNQEWLTVNGWLFSIEPGHE